MRWVRGHWRTTALLVGVLVIASGPLLVSDAVKRSCNVLNEKIDEGRGIPAKYRKDGSRIPTLGEVLTKAIRADHPEIAAQYRESRRAYPPLNRADCSAASRLRVPLF